MKEKTAFGNWFMLRSEN